MKRTAKILAIALGVILLTFIAIRIGYVLHRTVDTPKHSTVKVQTPPTRAELLKLVNNERAKVGVASLKEEALLDKSAQWKANDMVTHNYFSHVKPGTKGNDGLDYLNSHDKHGLCSYVSENILWVNDSVASSSAAVGGWVNSKPHYKAMVDPKYTLTGFGYADDGKKTYVVEHFCQTA